MDANFANRTLWTGDNLDILRGLNSETVDLIYLDPPFNSNRDYEVPVGSQAVDALIPRCGMDGPHADEQPALANILKASGLSHGSEMQSYLTMMAARLLEMHRVLQPTGSIYLHCDPYASHYLKMLMDSIFWRGHYRNEIVWRRTLAAKAGPRDPLQNSCGSVYDTLLFYAKADTKVKIPKAYPDDYRTEFRYSDKVGHTGYIG